MKQLLVIAAIVLTLTLSSASADWVSVLVTEVDNIENVDFLYPDEGICWGINYNDGAWSVEIITGEYHIKRVNPMVDYSPAIGCTRM